MCIERKQTPAYIYVNAIEKVRCTLMPQAVVFSISDNFCLVLYWSSLHFSTRPHPSPFYPGGFCRESFLSLSPGLASILHRLSRHCPRFFAVVPVETMRARFHNIEQSFISGLEGRDACGEGKQNVRQLLNVAGVAAPCWVDFAGVVIEDNWEQSPRGTARAVGSFCACMRRCMHVCACVRGDTAAWQSHTYTLIHVRDIYGSARREKIQRKFLSSTDCGVVCCTYLHKHSPLSKWTIRIRCGCISR